MLHSLQQYLDKPKSVPQINVDNFNQEDMINAIRHFGTFELVGPSIDKLSDIARKGLEKTKDILSLPEIELEKVEHQKRFHGYQNVRAQTGRNQIAFHFKPYLPTRAPEGKDVDVYQEYYQQGMDLLHRLYESITNIFDVNPDRLTPFSDDTQSVLSTRRYFKGIEGVNGIPAHSDYGLLTLVVSDKEGLEVYNEGEWLVASSEPNYRFYINIGDWLLFQLQDPLAIVGTHRVPTIPEERHSMALFFNPKLTQRLQIRDFETNKQGPEISFQDYLFNYIATDTSPFKKGKT